jgi:short subunit dehydrogenase-like uncharacterized protein
VRQGLRPLLAGRDAAALARQAGELGLPYAALDLSETAALEAALARVPLALHAAGPFEDTAAPMVEACLRTRTHYVDITGEIAVFEMVAARGAEARAAGVTLLPGAGFDVVPTDCLAAQLHARLPTATHLQLAFQSVRGRVSRGTALSMARNAGRGGAVRRGGEIVRVPAAWRTREVDFGRGPVRVVTIPWGDVSTAYHSTGIPNIEVYTRATAAQRAALRATRPLAPLLGSRAGQRLLEAFVRRRFRGPGAREREEGFSMVWGEVRDAAGGSAAARLRTPEGYTLTALAAVEAARRIAAGGVSAGFQTPSRAFGAEWVLELPGVGPA